MQKENSLKSVTKVPKSTKQTQENIVKAPKSTKQTDKLPVKFPQNTIQTYKNTTQSAQLDNLLREGLQEQASQYYVTEVHDRHLQDAFEQMHKNNVKNAQPKHLRIKKAMAAAIAAAVLVFGTISIASGGIQSIVAHSFNIPDYKSYQDLEKAAEEVGVHFYAPEQFANGYRFQGIYKVESQLEGDKELVLDSFTMLEVRYKKSDNKVILQVSPRPIMFTASKKVYTDTIVNNAVTYYYKEMHNKWVPVDYQPTHMEQKAVEEGRLNIGYGANEPFETDSKSFLWESNGQEYELFCMENDISKEELYEMALEIK